ncbi:DREV methyltransferase [Trypanosoma rangeli]|uniref:DREV methyltransferase n=1 Tax=Trypanosoma rangeli TaxID=5698 RepID=A0A3S5ISQ6_TRYRA|nr:DREV methyltransferase [Trypanosoma rangeli]RNF12767.1 DREV methyltransferase [Trypanosoma rangeli]|eukprot:RNF12767.1 DREV methyltransferase [Trypanosoma rangeli]
MNDLSVYWSGDRKKPAYSYAPQLVRLPQHIVSRYVNMHMDEETAEWLKLAADVNVTKLLICGILRGFVSHTTANGIMNRGGMFVISTAQAAQLLLGTKQGQQIPTKPVFGTLLDIGAGDGGVTSRLQPLFHHVTATEYSIPMRWRLWWRGYEVLPYQDPFKNKDGSRRCYDVIACLNVLDRTDKPCELLHSMRDSLSPDGRVLIAVVLPWCPFVEDGTRQRRPLETLQMEGGECCRGASFEDSLQRLVDNVFIPSGFKIERWCKLPYFCQGNLRVEYAVLHDAVFVLRRSDGDSTSLGQEDEQHGRRDP